MTTTDAAITPAAFLATIIAPAAELLPPAMDSPKARCLLLAIAGQESGLRRRAPDHPDGQRSFWRLGKNLAVLWSISHYRTRAPLLHVCATLGIEPPGLDAVFDALDTHDALAYCVARLLLVAAHPDEPLPEIGARDDAWVAYESTWLPLPADDPTADDRWLRNYDAAVRCFDRAGAA